MSSIFMTRRARGIYLGMFRLLAVGRGTCNARLPGALTLFFYAGMALKSTATFKFILRVRVNGRCRAWGGLFSRGLAGDGEFSCEI